VTAVKLALLLSELVEGDVRVLTLPQGDAGISDVLVETLDSKQTFLISVVDFTMALASKDR